MNYKNSVLRSLVLTLAIATAVPTASAHGDCASEALYDQASLIGTQLWEYLKANPIKSSFTLGLAASIFYTCMKKPQRDIKHHENLGWEVYDNVVCGQCEKEDGTKHFEDATGSYDRPQKIKATGLIGQSLALVKPLATAAGAFLLVQYVLGLDLPEFLAGKLGKKSAEVPTGGFVGLVRDAYGTTKL